MARQKNKQFRVFHFLRDAFCISTLLLPGFLGKLRFMQINKIMGVSYIMSLKIGKCWSLYIEFFILEQEFHK